MLGEIGVHECREGFHVDGKPWSDPHDPDANVVEPITD